VTAYGEWGRKQNVSTEAPGAFEAAEVVDLPNPGAEAAAVGPDAGVAAAPKLGATEAGAMTEASVKSAAETSAGAATEPNAAAGTRGIDAWLRKEAEKGDFGKAQIGVMAVRQDGRKVADYEGSGALVPASNVKLLTTGAAIDALGGDYKMTTRIASCGEIKDGTLHGDVYIIGGGDPTIGSGDSIAVPTQTLFRRWASFLAKAGIKSVEGRIIGDGRYFDGQEDSPAWDWGDLGTYYGTGGNGLCFNRNIIEIPVSISGDSVAIGKTSPKLPWLILRNETSVGKAGTGDNLYLYATNLSPVASMRGTFAKDRASRAEKCSNKFGAMTCAYEFYEYLKSVGIHCGGYADIDAKGRVRNFVGGNEKFYGKAHSEDSLKMLGSTESPEIKRIAYITNHRSDNFYAETLFRTLGKVKKGTAVYDSCLSAIYESMKAAGADIESGIRLADGSGLSRHNYVSPKFFCGFLKAMMDRDSFGDYINTLGQPGKGSYYSRVKDLPDSVKSRIHMKSGSMSGVVCFSGYIEPASGKKADTIIFSVMTNNFIGKTSEQYAFIDKVIARLAEESLR
jgi:D-alanyl-D-alanine carboxypeptidase/D-alanyl-D-alanine-endopeptidase (penicillin-binding protein 4)